MDNERIITELEEIKSETNTLLRKSIKMFIEDNETEKAFLEEMDLECIVKIIDKHIEELKQEKQ